MGRKGAALHALKRYNDAIAAYEEGLKSFPDDPALTKGLSEVKRDKDGPPAGQRSGGLFGPHTMAKLALDPKMRPYLDDKELMTKIQMIDQNPQLLPTMMGDPKVMEFMQHMVGAAADGVPNADNEGNETTPVPTAAPTKKEEPKEEVKEEPMEEDWSDLTPQEREKKEKQRDAVVAKSRGNELYKAKKFEEAIAAYDEAIALDTTNMTFLSNKAAVYFTQKNYDKCIEMCNSAMEVGKANMAPFEDRSKCLTRCAKAHQKKGDLGTAIEMCKASQLEFYNKDTQRLLKTLELEKKKADASAYQDDAKAEEAKQRGNDRFRAKEWAEAVKEYEEAVKRAPKNAAIRNNLSAALCKIMDFNGAKREIEVAVELDPKYVKAWARKGDIEFVMKEFHKSMDSYKNGLAIDPENSTCKEGLRKVTQQINYGRQNMTEEQKKEQAAHAMADPEIQAILQDPVTQQVLRDFQENPAAAQQAMNDPTVQAKIQKLIASGIIETR